MKTANVFKLTLGAALVIGIGFSTSPDTKAAAAGVAGVVTIGTPLLVQGNVPLDFGVLAAPTAGTETWVLDCSNVLTGPTPANDLFASDNTRGKLTISGEEDAAVDFSIAQTADFADANLSLHTPVLCTTSPNNLSGGSLEVFIGGSLDVSVGAATGDHFDAIVILTANYD